MTKTEARSAVINSPVGEILEYAVNNILITQKVTGEIPWAVGEKTDPWDMVESIMGLSISGHFEEARKGFLWFRKMQISDGSFYASYKDYKPEDKTKDTNMSSYVAVGLYHYYLITGDKAFVDKMWPCIKKSIEFVLSLQSEDGGIYWAKSPEGKVDRMYLLTGSSSIFMSLKAAICLSRIMNESNDLWVEAALKLRDILRYKRHMFNVSKSRFSMDWFYPVLCGALGMDDSRKRLEKYWKKFIVEGLGARCVSDNPWVTIAETCELVLALYSIGNIEQAKILYSWILDKRYEDDGSFWCGFTFPDMVVWPEERLAWTNSVAIMAADALYDISPASDFFSRKFWESKQIFD